MGVQEKQSRTRLRKHQFQRIVLNTVAVAGVVSVTLVAPQLLIAMKKMGLLPSKRHSTLTNTAIRRLIDSGSLEKVDGRLRITERGKLNLMRQTHLQRAVLKQKWDGRWRVLIFDIPEYRKGLRQKIRRTLRAVGFVRVQDSVWAFPYDCEDFIVLLKADFRVGKDILYIIADSLEGDMRLREHFKLPRA